MLVYAHCTAINTVLKNIMHDIIKNSCFLDILKMIIYLISPIFKKKNQTIIIPNLMHAFKKYINIQFIKYSIKYRASHMTCREKENKDMVALN